MHKAILLISEFLRYLARKLFLWVNVMSQRVPENYKPYVIRAKVPYAILCWAQFLETEIFIVLKISCYTVYMCVSNVL